MTTSSDAGATLGWGLIGCEDIAVKRRTTPAHGIRDERRPPHPNLHLPLVADFVTAVRAGYEPTGSGEVGLPVQRVLRPIYLD